MSELLRYLETIVEPTFEDFGKNPLSMRHAFLACVATFHAIDRAAYPKKPGNLKKIWRKESTEFTIVDMVAHHFKHVESNDERTTPRTDCIPLSSVVFGRGKAEHMDMHNLYFIVRDAIKFVRRQDNLS
jgi:hypothetical protein